MALSMYQQSVPNFVRALSALRGVLAKGAQHCEARKIDPVVLTSARLYPDMFPLTRQVQIACDMAKNCVTRLGDLEPVRIEDNEQSFADLQVRIDRTLDVLRALTPAQLDGSEDKAIVLKTPRGELSFAGEAYVQTFVLPNIYFHCTTAYDILRHNGVELSKFDFLGRS
ncbi:DUF1993 domain-containing protein [Panacagrimonas sp.]|uniref:DUF1993 domain-containing protein n=1 Tax=Panacagrimonas sp. TaxID=2480088 RepID=UPI003B51D202